MGQIQVYVILYFLAHTLAKRDNFKGQKSVNEEISDHGKGSQQKPSTGKTKNDIVVEKFIDSLLSSEKYLRMIETVEKRVKHMDALLHEKYDSISMYLSDILKKIKSSPSEAIEKALKSIRADLNTLKSSVVQPLNYKPNMRDYVAASADGGYHIDNALDNRLQFLESNVKSVAAGVDSIMSTISEVKKRQYSREHSRVESPVAGSLDSVALINEFRKTLRDQKVKKCDCSRNGRVDRSERYPTDCHEIQMQGFNISGIYKIKPDDIDPFYVLCDLNSAGGGWTVFHNRFDGSQDFYKGWVDYENGFGNLAGEFWLGLEKINCLTNQKLYELRIEIETQHGQDAFAGYSVFTVGSQSEGYRISTLGTYFGTAGDSLSYHAGQKFSTYDVDNDEWKDGSCASEHGGAWWYKECDKSNLNGKYSIIADEHHGQSMYWISFKGPNNPLTKSKMMIRPLPARKPSDYGDVNRNIAESSIMRGVPDKHKSRTKDVKGKYDLSHSYPPYRYDEHTRTDAFFPNYA